MPTTDGHRETNVDATRAHSIVEWRAPHEGLWCDVRRPS
jgi:hypothetical protein